MKHKEVHITPIGIFAICAVFVFLFIPADAKAQVSFRNLSLGELSTQLKTPEAIARYMWKNFVYEKDQRQFGKADRWQSPEEILHNKKGDCEDFALFAQSLLKANGISAFLLNVYGDGYAHTVCVYQENGKFNVIDGTTIKKYSASSLDELSEKIHPFWKKGAVVSPSNNQKSTRVLKSFEKRLKQYNRLRRFA